MMFAYVAYNQVDAFPRKLIVFCNYVYGFVTFSLTFPSALFILSVLVNLTGSISKMAENNSNSNSDAFLRFHRMYSSAIMTEKRDNIEKSLG